MAYNFETCSFNLDFPVGPKLHYPNCVPRTDGVFNKKFPDWKLIEVRSKYTEEYDRFGRGCKIYNEAPKTKLEMGYGVCQLVALHIDSGELVESKWVSRDSWYYKDISLAIQISGVTDSIRDCPNFQNALVEALEMARVAKR